MFSFPLMISLYSANDVMLKYYYTNVKSFFIKWLTFTGLCHVLCDKICIIHDFNMLTEN